jgi:2-dehydropantoate 2-reductase
MKSTTIIFAGIGGVGGYFGGILAKHYENSTSIKIKFLARGAHLKAIQKNGLKIITKRNEIVAYPSLATDNADKLEPPPDVNVVVPPPLAPANAAAAPGAG